MREEPMDAFQWFIQEIEINRRAMAAVIQQHRYLDAQHDVAFQRFMVKTLTST